jgi:hypothetical protein
VLFDKNGPINYQHKRVRWTVEVKHPKFTSTDPADIANLGACRQADGTWAIQST